MWNDIKNHRVSAALFAVYWLLVLALDVFGWRKPAERPEDMIPTVLYLHFLLPFIAGAVAGWWRRYREAKIAGGMLAGAIVSVVDVAALLTHSFLRFYVREPGGSNESVLELPVLLIAVGLIGSLPGLIGAVGTTGLGRLLDHEPAPDRRPAVALPLVRAAAIVPHARSRKASGLAITAAAMVALVVIPNLRAVPGKAVLAFAVSVLLNLLIGITLLAVVSRRNAVNSKILVIMAGFTGLLLGTALLDAAGAVTAHGPGPVVAAIACLVCAAADLGAGVLAISAAFRWR
jgi:hypothetical protein